MFPGIWLRHKLVAHIFRWVFTGSSTSENSSLLCTGAVRSICSHCDVRSCTETDKLIIKCNSLFTRRKLFTMSIALTDANQLSSSGTGKPCWRLMFQMSRSKLCPERWEFAAVLKAEAAAEDHQHSQSQSHLPLCSRGWLHLRMHHSAQGGEYLGILQLQKPYLCCYLWAAESLTDWMGRHSPNRYRSQEAQGVTVGLTYGCSPPQEMLFREKTFWSCSVHSCHPRIIIKPLKIRYFLFFFLFSSARLLLQDLIQNHNVYPNQSLEQYFSSIQSMAQSIATA